MNQVPMPGFKPRLNWIQKPLCLSARTRCLSNTLIYTEETPCGGNPAHHKKIHRRQGVFCILPCVQSLPTPAWQDSCYCPSVWWLPHWYRQGHWNRSHIHSEENKNGFSFLLRKLFTLIHLIPWLICHWSLKQSIFYGDFSYLWTKFKLANEFFLLSLLQLKEREKMWVDEVEGERGAAGADGAFQQVENNFTAEEKYVFQRTKKNTKLGLFSSN